MAFLFALFIVPAMVIANNLYGNNGIVAVLFGTPFVIPALAIIEAIIRALLRLFRG